MDKAEFPSGLLDWSGNRAGGVKKLFYEGSGRPAGEVVKTALLSRLAGWAHDIGSGNEATPPMLLLVGGPGNGKTEGVEFTIQQLDMAMSLQGALVQEFARMFSPPEGEQMPRLALAHAARFPAAAAVKEIAVVQDASESQPGAADSPALLFVQDMRRLLEGCPGRVYIACVNRGILDDALILTEESGDARTSSLLKQVVRSVSLAADAPACWPLEGFPRFAVWPMDVESLVEDIQETPSPARQVLDIATQAEKWPEKAGCPAGERCPFCTSRALLCSEPHRGSLLRILRWFELASGKRWNFRDLYSLVAYILAGTSEGRGAGAYSPCIWAASQVSPSGSDLAKVEVQRVRGLFKLVASQYQHALFGSWPIDRARGLRADIAELKLQGFPVLAALHLFLSQDTRPRTTPTLAAQLAGLSTYLDPAFAHPALSVSVSGNTTIKYEDLDRRFSVSVQEGRRFLSKFQCLSPLELDLLKALEQADSKLSEEGVRRLKPGTADRVQSLVRAIACRIARRSVGVRSGATRDADTLEDFHKVLRGHAPTLQEATQQVESLLNVNKRFVVSLNTTFGEPLPPPERRAMLTTDVQRVREFPRKPEVGRPVAPVRFLRVGGAEHGQPVALTFELFRATKALRRGMVPSSLPRSVVALLDTTRARLAGTIVRNEEALDSSEIAIGIREEVIVNTYSGFVVRRGDAT